MVRLPVVDGVHPHVMGTDVRSFPLFPGLPSSFSVKVGDPTAKRRGHVPDHNGSFNRSHIGDNGYARGLYGRSGEFHRSIRILESGEHLYKPI